MASDNGAWQSGAGHESSAFREEDVSQVQNHPSSRRAPGHLRRSPAQAASGL